ncbi:hypothetical protein I551_1328 [Mycobacterium ulcerans str. Harvey]|uniref:Uncharacterized protein n=1 Tax=Mycobacterium ulcerans str. Harvey TaxID=1299332 RepID=A0ABP3ALY1_MYCUL|nr:hypothetical protein I551_1328 [Mycobacterium ulcerans str. Harvey]
MGRAAIPATLAGERRPSRHPRRATATALTSRSAAARGAQKCE